MAIDRELSTAEQKISEFITSVAQEMGLEVYEFEYLAPQKLLRVYIMNPETKSALIDECVEYDRALTPFFEDEKSPVFDYGLEVSSPGVFRPLTKKGHFEAAVGEQVMLKLNEKIEAMATGLHRSVKGKKIVGLLKSMDDSAIVVELRGGDATIGFDQIKKGNLEPSFD